MPFYQMLCITRHLNEYVSENLLRLIRTLTFGVEIHQRPGHTSCETCHGQRRRGPESRVMGYAVVTSEDAQT